MEIKSINPARISNKNEAHTLSTLTLYKHFHNIKFLKNL